MNKIIRNIQCIFNEINVAAHNSKQDPRNILLVAVTKNQSIKIIDQAVSAGQYNFGENYTQEAIKKINWFRYNSNKKIIWHFIGSIQSNKSRIIAKNFDWCHSVCCPKLAYRLNNQRPKTIGYLNVLIQINISNNYTKSGIRTIHQMLKLASIIVNQCSQLQLRGIMSMSIPSTKFKEQMSHFKIVYTFFQQLKSIYAYANILSLGMSNDMIAAIYTGSNCLRIGTAIFGSRKK